MRYQSEPTPMPTKADHYDPIAAALKEDIGQGDITTDFFVPATLHATGRIITRERAVVAGTGTVAEVFRQVDPSIDTQILHRDSDEVVAGDVIIEVRGLARSILKAERVALNFLQRLCGIATLTRQFVEAVGNYPVKILDTRKTTPGLRALEQVRGFIEVGGIDVILLDNMTPAQIREAVALRKDKVEFEASGAITLKNVRRIAATGVDYISVGSLTHSPRAIDISLEMTHVPA